MAPGQSVADCLHVLDANDVHSIGDGSRTAQQSNQFPQADALAGRLCQVKLTRGRSGRRNSGHAAGVAILTQRDGTGSV